MKNSCQLLGNGIELCWDSEWMGVTDIINNAKTMQEMKELDRNAIELKGIPSLWLMENAAHSVVSEVAAYIEGNGLPRRVVIVCGAGNNGGDGVACAYMLLDMGYDVKAYLCGHREKMTSDELEMERRLNAEGGVLIDMFEAKPGIVGEGGVYSQSDCIYKLDDLRADIEQAECCIDALFGVGITRDIASPHSEVIEVMNGAKYIFSCDIPSGVNGDTGRIMGTAVKSDTTVTFSYIKKGLLADGIGDCCKRLVVVPIGLP